MALERHGIVGLLAETMYVPSALMRQQDHRVSEVVRFLQHHQASISMMLLWGAYKSIV